MRLVSVLAVAGLASTALAAPGDTLVGDPFILGYNGWVDASPPTVGGGPPNWGIHLRDGALQEASDGHGGTSAAATDGKYTPYVMVNNFMTPADYVYSSTLASFDNDGFGVVFGFQDNQNYFRVGLRNQTPGNLGFGQGVSVQKVVGGVITQLAQDLTTFIPPNSFNHTSFTNIGVEVKVNGTNWAVHINGNAAPILSGSDLDLKPGKIGVHSWFQLQNGATLASGSAQWGTELRKAAVTAPGGATLFEDNFGTLSQAAVSPVPWRNLTMTPTTGSGIQDQDDYGNFRLDFRRRAIVEDSNGFNNATAGAPNVDFTAPAIVVDSPGAASFSDYKMTTRLVNGDNDGIGLLLRVQDDNNFYRVTFHTDPAAIGTTRPPRGMSVQKVRNGVWSEIFREDQAGPFAFMFDSGVPFDVRVIMVGNTMRVRVIKNPDTLPEIIDYPLIVDNSDPLLTGSVGFTNWGNGDAAAPGMWMAYGGIAGHPLLTEIPEPATCLLAAGGLLMLARRRMRRA